MKKEIGCLGVIEISVPRKNSNHYSYYTLEISVNEKVYIPKHNTLIEDDIDWNIRLPNKEAVKQILNIAKKVYCTSFGIEKNKIKDLNDIMYSSLVFTFYKDNSFGKLTLSESKKENIIKFLNFSISLIEDNSVDF